MEPTLILLVAVLFVIIIVFFLAMPSIKLKQEEYAKTGKYPKGHFMGIGIALGIPLGMPIGLALGNIALGPALGLPIGVAIGAAMEKKNQDKIRPMTEAELKLKKRATIAGVLVALVGLLAFVFTFFYLR
jgi:hypothetical protein